MKWQTIDTAPRDGTRVMLYKFHDGLGWHVLGHGYFVGDDPVVRGWVTSGFTDPPGNLGLAAPSHWMPLPNPPEEP